MATQAAPKTIEKPVDLIFEAKKFLVSFGVDIEGMDEEALIVLMEKIEGAQEEQIQVLSRGASVDGMQRLLNRVPKGFVGEFKGNTDLEIDQAKAVGWEIFYDEAAKKESVTAGADSRVKLADCILMVIPVEKYIAIRMAKRERNKERRDAHRPAKQAETQGSTLPIPVRKNRHGNST